MIIDFHTHTFPEFLAGKAISKLENYTYTKAFTDGTTQGLLTAMEEGQVDLSVVLPVATSPKQVEVCNNGAIQLNKDYTDRLLSFGAMHPDYEDYKRELRRIKGLGIKGIKLHPDYQGAMFDDIRCKRIVEAASELDLIVLIHAGLDIGLGYPIHANPKHIRNVIREVQPKNLVLGHMGGFGMWDEVLELLAGENVFLDTAFSLGKINYWEDMPEEVEKTTMMSTAQFMELFKVFGEERILFATDSPWCSQKKMIEEIKHLPITERQKELILGENARKLLGLV